MLKGLFGKTRADGGFDMRFKSNKGGWFGKMGRSAVVQGLGSLGVSGFYSAKKAIGEGLSEYGDAFLVQAAPVIVEMINEHTWKNHKKQANKNLNNFITTLPSAETEKEKRVLEYIDQAFEKSASYHKRVRENYEKTLSNDKKNPEILKKIDVTFYVIHDLMWVNKRFSQDSAISKDLRPSMFKSTSPIKQFKSIKENKKLKDVAMKHYNNKSDELFQNLFKEILELFSDDEKLGAEFKKKYLKYEKARFEITLYNNSYLSIPEIWFRRVFNIEKEE